MQLFPCPFCGERDETEFHFGTDAGTVRPGPDCPAEPWAEYLYYRNNPKGEATELWRHDACGQWFHLRRDTVSHVILGAKALGGEG